MRKVIFQMLCEDAILPCYAHVGDAGLDLFSVEDIIIPPLERVLVHTGVSMEIPEGFEAQIRPKSGLSLNYGITVLNTPGTIDENYRGEIGVICFNVSKTPFNVAKGTKIAQMVINKVEYIKPVIGNISINTSRGEDGYGSTGLKRDVVNKKAKENKEIKSNKNKLKK